MALARGGWAVLLAEGTLQEQLREREGGEAVAAGIEARDPGSVTRYNLFRQRRGRLGFYCCNLSVFLTVL